MKQAQLPAVTLEAEVLKALQRSQTARSFGELQRETGLGDSTLKFALRALSLSKTVAHVDGLYRLAG